MEIRPENAAKLNPKPQATTFAATFGEPAGNLERNCSHLWRTTRQPPATPNGWKRHGRVGLDKRLWGTCRTEMGKRGCYPLLLTPISKKPKDFGLSPAMGVSCVYGNPQNGGCPVGFPSKPQKKVPTLQQTSASHPHLEEHWRNMTEIQKVSWVCPIFLGGGHFFGGRKSKTTFGVRLRGRPMAK